jgi:hypothetical protein
MLHINAFADVPDNEPTINKDIIASISLDNLIRNNATLTVNYQTIPSIFEQIKKNDRVIMRYISSDDTTMIFKVSFKNHSRLKITPVAKIDVYPTCYGGTDKIRAVFENIKHIQFSDNSIITDIFSNSNRFDMYIGILHDEETVEKLIDSEENKQIVWIVQQFVSGVYDHRKEEYTFCSFELTGIYNSQQKADDACLDETYVMGPIEINHTFPRERVEATDSYYPRQKKSEQKRRKINVYHKRISRFYAK